MPAASGMPKVYYDVYNNIKAKFERNGGYIGKTKYLRWQGAADQRAHQIAKSYVDKRQSNKTLADKLDYYYQKSKEIEMNKSFNHPDYKHVHSKEY